MVEVLLIKITKTINITGVTFALRDTRAEAFADDTTLFMKRCPNNLKYATKYITAFHKISGLACNLDKTHIIPIGVKNNPKDILCHELGMSWTDTFTILGFEIDNKLEKLKNNFTLIHDKIKSIIRNRTPYKLSLRGRLTIEKTLLTSQLTYVASILTPTDKTLEEIQTTIDNYIQDITTSQKNWINKELLITPQKHGGLVMIKLDDFSLANKVAWLRRYAIIKTNDHWADIIDTHLGLTIDTRTDIFKFGPERFNKLIKFNLPAISGIMAAYKVLAQQFPNTIESNDNTWLHQPVFYNNNFTRKYPGKCKQTIHLTPTFYGLEDQLHTFSVMDFYNSMTFKTNKQIELTTGTKLTTIQYASLKGHITSHIGHQKKYDGLVKETTPQKKPL